MLNKTGSLDSWETPWETSRRNRRQPVVHHSQSCRNVNMTCFIICLMSVLLLTSGIALLGVSVWSLLRKTPYRYLLGVKVDIFYFSLPAAIICFPSFWISVSIHNNKNKEQFFHVLILLLLIIATLNITGSTIGMLYTAKHKSNKGLTSSLDDAVLNASLQSSIIEYDSNPVLKYAWDKTQTQLNCCGISDNMDWLKTRLYIPDSCCTDGFCYINNTYQRGCLDSLSRDLVWHRNLMNSQNYMCALCQIIFIIIIVCIIIAGKWGRQEPSQ